MSPSNQWFKCRTEFVSPYPTSHIHVPCYTPFFYCIQPILLYGLHFFIFILFYLKLWNVMSKTVTISKDIPCISFWQSVYGDLWVLNYLVCVHDRVCRNVSPVFTAVIYSSILELRKIYSSHKLFCSKRFMHESPHSTMNKFISLDM